MLIGSSPLQTEQLKQTNTGDVRVVELNKTYMYGKINNISASQANSLNLSYAVGPSYIYAVSFGSTSFTIFRFETADFVAGQTSLGNTSTEFSVVNAPIEHEYAFYNNETNSLNLLYETNHSFAYGGVTHTYIQYDIHPLGQSMLGNSILYNDIYTAGFTPVTRETNLAKTTDSLYFSRLFFSGTTFTSGVTLTYAYAHLLEYNLTTNTVKSIGASNQFNAFNSSASGLISNHSLTPLFLGNSLIGVLWMYFELDRFTKGVGSFTQKIDYYKFFTDYSLKYVDTIYSHDWGVNPNIMVNTRTHLDSYTNNTNTFVPIVLDFDIYYYDLNLSYTRSQNVDCNFVFNGTNYRKEVLQTRDIMSSSSQSLFYENNNYSLYLDLWGSTYGEVHAKYIDKTYSQALNLISYSNSNNNSFNMTIANTDAT